MNNELFAAFGITEEDIKKETTAKKKDTSGTGKTKKNEKKTEYELPLEFCGGFWHNRFSGEGKIGKKKLLELIAEDIRELSGMITDFEIIAAAKKEDKEQDVTYVKPVMHFIEEKDDTALTFPLSVMTGCAEHMAFDEELSLQEILEKWVEANPDFAGCKFHYNKEVNALIPFFTASEPTGVSYDLPVTAGLGSEVMEITEELVGEASVSYEKLRELLSCRHPEYRDCGFVYNQELNQVIPVVKYKGSSGQKVDRVLLPANVRAGGFQLTVQPEDINGQRTATLEEIRKAIEIIYPEYAKERTEMVYDEEKQIVIPILKSSRKGLTVHSEKPGWSFSLETDAHGDRWRKEIRPFGTFQRNETADGELEFRMTAPKIPGSILQEIKRRFRRDPSKEAAVQIFYDAWEKEYAVYEPPQRRRSGSVSYLRNSRMEAEKVLVMDVHSHGKMNAFFSAIDDYDEKGVQLYMVLGQMDRPACSYALRAGMAGYFASLPIEDIFDGGEAL